MALRVFWLAVLLLAGPPATFGDDGAGARTVEAAARAWIEAFNAHDADAMVAHSTHDIVLMDATLPPISGAKAARAAWRRSLPGSGARTTSTTKELQVAGDVAWRIAAYAHVQANGQLIGRGQALEIWKRVDGEWKLHRQMSSGLLARQPLLRRPLPTEPVLDRPEQMN